MATPAGRVADKKCKARPAGRVADKKRKATPAGKAAARKRKAEPLAMEADARRTAARRAERRVGKHRRVLQARASRQQEVLTATGSWASTAHAAAAAHGSMTSVPLPPAFAAIHNERCLTYTRQMYEALDLVTWNTCVVCWRAWYAPPKGYLFEPSADDRCGGHAWFNFNSSTVLGAQRRKHVDKWFLHADGSSGSPSQARAFYSTTSTLPSASVCWTTLSMPR